MSAWAVGIVVMLNIIAGAIALLGGSLVQEGIEAGIATTEGWIALKAGATMIALAIGVSGFAAMVSFLKDIRDRLSERPPASR